MGNTKNRIQTIDGRRPQIMEDTKVNSMLEMMGNGTEKDNNPEPDPRYGYILNTKPGGKKKTIKEWTKTEPTVQKKKAYDKFQEIFNTVLPVIKGSETAKQIGEQKSGINLDGSKGSMTLDEAREITGETTPADKTASTFNYENLKDLPALKDYHQKNGTVPMSTAIDVDKNGNVKYDFSKDDSMLKKQNDDIVNDYLKNLHEGTGDETIPQNIKDMGDDAVLRYKGYSKVNPLENLFYQGRNLLYESVYGIKNVIGEGGKKLIGNPTILGRSLFPDKPMALPQYTSGNETLDFAERLPYDLALLGGGIKLGTGIVNMTLGKLIKSPKILKVMGEGLGFTLKSSPKNLSDFMTGKTDAKTYTLQTLSELGTGAIFGANPLKSFGGRTIYNAFLPTLMGIAPVEIDKLVSGTFDSEQFTSEAVKGAITQVLLDMVMSGITKAPYLPKLKEEIYDKIQQTKLNNITPEKLDRLVRDEVLKTNDSMKDVEMSGNKYKENETGKQYTATNYFELKDAKGNLHGYTKIVDENGKSKVINSDELLDRNKYIETIVRDKQAEEKVKQEVENKIDETYKDEIAKADPQIVDNIEATDLIHQLRGKENANQKQSTAKVSIRKTPGDSKTLGKGDELQKPAGKEKADVSKSGEKETEKQPYEMGIKEFDRIYGQGKTDADKLSETDYKKYKNIKEYLSNHKIPPNDVYPNIEKTGELRKKGYKNADLHYHFIKQALEEGKTVPEEVLKDYPEETPKIDEKPTKEVKSLAQARQTLKKQKKVSQTPESVSVQPDKEGIEKELTPFEKAQEKRKQNIIEKAKPEIDKRLDEGYKPVIKQIKDKKVLSELQREYDYLKKEAPTGNENHPDTKRLREVEKQLKGDVTKPSYRLEKDDDIYEVNKTQYEYALEKSKETTPIKPKPDQKAEKQAETPKKVEGIKGKDIVEQRMFDELRQKPEMVKEILDRPNAYSSQWEDAAIKINKENLSKNVKEEKGKEETNYSQFSGNKESGDILKRGDKEYDVIGNYDKKKVAEVKAHENGGTVKPYLNGKYKSGWLVIKEKISEPIATEKINDLKDKTKPVKTDVPLKEQKENILGQLNEIKKVIDKTEDSKAQQEELKKLGYKISEEDFTHIIPFSKDENGKPREENLGKQVHIDILGDGKFKIPIQNINSFIEKIKKEYPVTDKPKSQPFRYNPKPAEYSPNDIPLLKENYAEAVRSGNDKLAEYFAKHLEKFGQGVENKLSGEVPKEPVSNKYFISTEGGFREVKDAKPVKLDYDGDYFVTSKLKYPVGGSATPYTSYEISEAKSGMHLATGTSLEEAIKYANENIKRGANGDLNSYIEKKIKEAGNISPRYQKLIESKPQEKDVQFQKGKKSKKENGYRFGDYITSLGEIENMNKTKTKIWQYKIGGKWYAENILDNLGTTTKGKFQAEKLQSKDYKLFQKAKDEFGTTDDWNEAGYILPDGDLLDFSGKNQGGYGGTRNLDHRDINSIDDDMDMQTFIGLGAIRFMPESKGIYMDNKPEGDQFSRIRELADVINGEMLVELKSGNNRYFEEYPKYTDAQTIIDDIKYFYDNPDADMEMRKHFREDYDPEYQKKKQSAPETETRLRSMADAIQKAFPNITQNLLYHEDFVDALKKEGIEFQKDYDVPLGATYKGQTYTNLDRADLDTPFHEFGGHIFNRIMKAEKPGLYDMGMKLVAKDTDYLNEIQKQRPELKGIALQDEALSQAIGENGAKLFEKMQDEKAKQTMIKRFQAWLKNYWDKMKEIMIGRKMEVEKLDLQTATLKDFTDAVAKDILSGKKLSDMSSEELAKGLSGRLNESAERLGIEMQKPDETSRLTRKAMQEAEFENVRNAWKIDKIKQAPEDVLKNEKYKLSDKDFKEKKEDLKIVSSIIIANNKGLTREDFTKAVKNLMANSKKEPMLLNDKQTGTLWTESKKIADRIVSENERREKQLSTVGIKKESIKSEREARGLPELKDVEVLHNKDVVEQAQAKIRNENVDLNTFRNGILNRKDKSMSVVEEAMLGIDRVNLNNRKQEILSQLDKAYKENNQSEIARLEGERVAVSVQQDINDKALNNVSDAARLLQFRTRMFKDDMSLENVMRDMRLADPKKPLTFKEEKDMTEKVRLVNKADADLQKHIDEQSKRIKELEEKNAQLELEKTYSKAKRDTKFQERKEKRQRSIQEIDEHLNQLKAKLKENAEKRAKGLSANIGLADNDMPILTQMFKDYVGKGVLKASDIVDNIYNDIADYYDGLDKRALRDAISGYNKKKEFNKSELTVNLNNARTEMKLLSKIEDAQNNIKPTRTITKRELPDRITQLKLQLVKELKDRGLKVDVSNESKLKAYKTSLDNRIKDYEERLKTGNFTRTPRKSIDEILDTETLNKRAYANKLRQDIQKVIREREYAARPKYQKVLGTVVKVKRQAVLSGIATAGKLTTYGTAKTLIVNGIQDFAGEGLGRLPGISQIFEKSPLHSPIGLGLMGRSYAQQIVEFSKALIDYKGAWGQIKTGKSKLDLTYGVSKLPPEALEFFGHLHGVLKEPTKRANFLRGLTRRTEFAIKNGENVNDPAVIYRLNTEAYLDGLDSILLGQNEINKAYNQFLGKLTTMQSDANPLKRIGATATKTLLQIKLPVAKVPTNYVIDTMGYLFGDFLVPPYIIAKGGGLKNFGKIWKTAMSNMKPGEADMLAGLIKKNTTLGLGSFILGALFPNSFGGYYQSGKKEEGDVKPGQIRLFGLDFPMWVSHLPPIEAMQFGATFSRVFNKKKDDVSTFQGIIDGLGQSLLGLVREIPFVGTTADELKSLFGTKTFSEKANQLVGEETTGFLPIDLKKYAKAHDKIEDDDGELNKFKNTYLFTGEDTHNLPRKPENIWQEIEMGIPGLRENVPIDEKKLDKIKKTIEDSKLPQEEKDYWNEHDNIYKKYQDEKDKDKKEEIGKQVIELEKNPIFQKGDVEDTKLSREKLEKSEGVPEEKDGMKWVKTKLRIYLKNNNEYGINWIKEYLQDKINNEPPKQTKDYQYLLKHFDRELKDILKDIIRRNKMKLKDANEEDKEDIKNEIEYINKQKIRLQ
jgi:hypothetical protein